MIILNLIPKELKNKIKLKRINSLFGKINTILIIFAVIIISPLIISRFILQNKFDEIIKKTEIQEVEYKKEHATKVQNINHKINLIYEIQGDFIPWSKLINDLINKSSDNISFSYIKIDKDNKEVKIKGDALLRDDLLDFKKNLEDSSIYGEIDFPIKNILQKENINFEIGVKINLLEIK
ncbi:MAG: hypothetical protein ABIA02_01330 [Candidatus Falkowbacteria bacterium]